MRNRYGINVVCVDYDGTLTTENAYPAVGTPNVRAIEIMKRFRKAGGKVILWTLRTNQYLSDALDAMKGLGLEFDAVNENLKEHGEKWLKEHPECSLSNKAFADMYIDDRSPDAILNGLDWDAIEQILLVPVQF